MISFYFRLLSIYDSLCADTSSACKVNVGLVDLVGQHILVFFPRSMDRRQGAGAAPNSVLYYSGIGSHQIKKIKKNGPFARPMNWIYRIVWLGGSRIATVQTSDCASRVPLEPVWDRLMCSWPRNARSWRRAALCSLCPFPAELEMMHHHPT